VIFSFQLHSKKLLTKEMQKSLMLNLLFKQLMDQQQWKLNKLCLIEDTNFYLMFYAMQVVLLSVISNG